MYSLLPLLFLVLLVGCSTHSSGVLKVGPDTYTVSTSAGPWAGGIVEAKRMALSEANQYCAQQGKDIFVISKEDPRMGPTEVTFRCLKKGASATQ